MSVMAVVIAMYSGIAMDDGGASKATGGVAGGIFSFNQPVGALFAREGLRGYYIDMRTKAKDPRWPPPELLPLDHQLVVDIAQWGLGAFERYLHGEGDRWLAAARAVAEHLVAAQENSGNRAGAWIHPHPYPHTFDVGPQWVSAMAQGQAASLLCRIAGEACGDASARLSEAAVAALEPLRLPRTAGGAAGMLDGGPFPQEYPTEPDSHVLNGAIFAMWGARDVAETLGDVDASEMFDRWLDVLAQNIHRWDVGYWSRYDLFPHPIVNVATPAYHELHINQLNAMCEVASRPELEDALHRFVSYRANRIDFARALAKKVVFRILMPRRRPARSPAASAQS